MDLINWARREAAMWRTSWETYDDFATNLEALAEALERAEARIAELEELRVTETRKWAIAEVRAECAEAKLAAVDQQRENFFWDKQRAEAERDSLRKNFAKYLVPAYRAFPLETARTCDEELDQSGALLGYVRDAALAALNPPLAGEKSSR